MNQTEFLIQHLTEGKSYKEISEAYGIKREQLSNWWETGVELRNLIKKSNTLFNNKNKVEEFEDFRGKGRRAFFEWYSSQKKECFYCGIAEEKLKKIFDFDSGILETKRGRGRTLELERRDASKNNNVYNELNCVLACYLCNNHKSDLISEKDHLRYFAKPIREYLESKYVDLTSAK